jgi:glycosyltransferase involved in cell wall biosynthesis
MTRIKEVMKRSESSTGVRDPITVVTITRGRPELLARAMGSVAAQDYSGPIVHRVVVDDAPELYADVQRTLPSTPAGPREQVWVFATRTEGETSGPARLARLRNRAVRAATTRLVAFLDDDNEFEPHHLSSLVDCMAQTGAAAVHSHRRLFLRNGTPYIEHRMPWKRDRREGRAVYEELREMHVFIHGSNVIRDRARHTWQNDAVRMVDTSEWLFERDLLLRVPFCEEYSYEDWVEVRPEDNKLVRALVAAGVTIACTHMPSLRYYLGGYSNTFPPRRPGRTPLWCTE